MNKRIILCLLGVILIFSVGFVSYEIKDESTLATLNLRIEKDSEGIWRVRDLNGHSQGIINAASNDKINWQNRTSEVVFAFPKDVEAYFEFKRGLFEDGRTQKLNRNGNLRFTVKEDAPSDTLHYEIFVVSEGKFVQGNSPPVIIIKK